jgi:hypothetical protein
MVAARKKRVPAPNSPKLPNVENLSRAGLKNRSNNITFHATYPPNYSKKVGAVILRIWYSIVRIEKEKSLASCGAFPALESPLLQNLMGKGAAAMPSNRNMTRTNESFIRVTQLPSFQSASPFVSANASIAHTNEALPPTSQVTCFHEDGRGHQGNPSPNSPEIKHKAAMRPPAGIFSRRSSSQAAKNRKSAPKRRIALSCQRILVVLAVSSKPLSHWHFPANREFSREISRF